VRVAAIDTVRGLAVAVMIVVHCFAFFASHDAQEHGPGFVILDVAKLTAVFLLCMGLSSAFSRARAPRDLAARGLRLLALGYALNVLKFLVPLFVLGNLPDALTIDLGWEVGAPETTRAYLLLGDILHLAGLSLIVVAAARALGARPAHLIAGAAAVALVAPFTWGFRAGGPVSTYLCDLLFSERFTVFFPLFPWLAYVLVGHALGERLAEAGGDPRATLRRWMPGAALLVVASVAVGVAWPAAWQGWDFYRTGPAGVGAVIGLSLVLFAIAPAPGRVLAYLSGNVTRLYVISWIVICWSVGWVGFMSHDDALVLSAITIAVLAATFAIDAIVPRDLQLAGVGR
jgi:uncharacterized membrane protein